MKTAADERDLISPKKKTSSAAVLARLKREMAKPRRAESTQKDADTHANGGHLPKG